MDEKRKVTRRRTLKGARIVAEDGMLTLECLVRNLSPSGAALQLPSTFHVPKQFQLVFDDGSQTRRCKVVWGSATRLGVEFESGD